MFTFHESLCPFFCEKSSDFPFESLWTSYFVPQTNSSHLINYRIDRKARANCENLQRCWFTSWVKGFSAIKNFGSKTTNHSQLAWPFDLQVKQTKRKIACDWLIFSRSQTRCLAVSDRLILSSWFNIAFLKNVIHICSTKAEIEKEKFQCLKNGKIEDCSSKKKPARYFASSRD